MYAHALRRITDPLLSWFRHILIRLEQGSYVQSLAAPDPSVDRPVETQLQGPAVEGTASLSAVAYS